jgi:hypothetical protein
MLRLMYESVEQAASVDNVIHLRKISGLSLRPREAIEKALPSKLLCL